MRWVLALALVLPALGGRAQDRTVAAEYDRLSRDVFTSIPESDRPGLVSRLERGRAALAAGRSYLALFDLQAVYEGEAGYRLSAAAKDVATDDEFKARWSRMGEPRTDPGRRAKVYFVEALAQSSEGRAPATYRASLPYAQDAGLPAGLYYLGESHAMTRFAALCRAVDATPAGKPPDLAPVAPSLNAYERQVVKAYDAAPANLRPRFAQVHVAIKLAHTLDESQRAEGALLYYLLSRYRYALIQREGLAAPAVADVTTRLAATRLPAGDHSIAEFFLQLAASSLAASDPAPHGAAAILDDVLPAYFELVKQ